MQAAVFVVVKKFTFSETKHVIPRLAVEKGSQQKRTFYVLLLKKQSKEK